jgi:sugar (pentulose or hexulose) kinase
VTQAILIDLGASRTKAVLYERGSSTVLDQMEVASPSFELTPDGKVEINGELYWEIFTSIIHCLISRNKKYSVKKVYICSEMHGFLLATKNGIPRTGYISWRDQRASRDPDDLGRTTLDYFRDNDSGAFRFTTGMTLKAGLPIITLASMRKRTDFPAEPLMFLSLPEWILVRGGCKAPLVHPTMAAGSGLFDINRFSWTEELLADVGICHQDFLFSPLSDVSNFLGEITVTDQKFLVYGGIGDLQCALHGAGINQPRTAVMNLGTGSQVAVLGLDASKQTYEARLSVHNKNIRTISHIPAGRALNAFAHLFDDISLLGGGAAAFWNSWAKLDAESIIEAKLNCELGIFDGAWEPSNIGHRGWIEIREGYADSHSFLCGLAKGWLIQYVRALELILDSQQSYQVKIAGGLSRRGKFILPVLKFLCDRPIFLSHSNSEEETLEGLKNIFNY